MAMRSRGSRSQTILKTPPSPDDPSKVKKTSKQARKRRLGCCSRLLLIVVGGLLACYITVPFLIRFSPWLQQALVFVHHVRTPLYGNISNPSEFGLQNAREFELFHENGCEIEVWQILTKLYTQHNSLKENFTEALSDGSPIVLYLHGNTGTRATYHRVQLYKYLAEERGYHVITFDYRGFGNSLCFPSERGMMEDGLLIWTWIKKHAPNSKVYVWGHSLGSTAATFLTKELCDTEDTTNEPHGLILDAPLTNIIDAGTNHPFSVPYWPIMSLFRNFVLENFQDRFESANRLKDITIPILIFHGHKDFIIPFHIGEKMHRIAVENSTPGHGMVEFVDCGDTAHKNNYVSPLARAALDTFIPHN